MTVASAVYRISGCSLIVCSPFRGRVPPATDAAAGGSRGSANREDPLHPERGMSRHGAEIAVLALLLERDQEPRRLARLEQRRDLPVDLEVVRDVAGVLEDECDLAGPRNRLGRQLEKVLAAFDLDRGCGRGRLPGCACRGERHQRESRDPKRNERGDRTDGELSHCSTSLRISRHGWSE